MIFYSIDGYTEEDGVQGVVLRDVTTIQYFDPKPSVTTRTGTAIRKPDGTPQDEACGVPEL